MLNQIKYKKRIVLIEFVILIILPLLLLHFFPKLLILRTAAMILGIFYIFLMIRLYHINRINLGFGGKNKFLISFMHMLPWIILSSIVILILYNQNAKLFIIPGIQANSLALKLPYSLLLYWLISAPLQELLFRAYYINRLEKVIKNNTFIILISSFVFALVHIPFGSWFLTLGSFVLGIILASHFLKYRNIATMIVTHSWFGSIIVLLNTS